MKVGDPDQATTFDQYIDRKPGYSVFDIATGFSKLQITEVNPSKFTFAKTAQRAYVTLDGGDAEGAFVAVQQIELDSGVVRTVELGSPPDAIGVLPDSNKVFVSQRHPLGRVSFTTDPLHDAFQCSRSEKVSRRRQPTSSGNPTGGKRTRCVGIRVERRLAHDPSFVLTDGNEIWLEVASRPSESGYASCERLPSESSRKELR